MRVWLALACMLIFCEGCRGGIVGKYKCYPKYTKDELQQMKTRGDKAVCESKPGFKYTRGNDALAPGCGHCWCCQPLQPVVGKYKCYPKYTKDELQQMKTRGDKAVCESKPGFKYTRGNDALAPGCGYCWCCQPLQPDAFTNQRALADFKQPPYHLGSGVQGALQSNGDFIFQVPDPVNRKMIRTTNLGVTVKIGFLPVQTTTWTNSNSWNYAPKGFYQLKHFRAYNKDDAFHQAAYADFWQPPHHLGTDVKGVCLPNGDFIFQVFDQVFRKMVRTTNSGVTVKIGYLPTKSETWTDSDSWTDMPNGFYQIKNFQDKTMNLAKGKQATQSPYYHHYVSATNAVDGNTGTNYVNDKCTHTSDRSETRWWMVDLEKPSSIEKVTLFNRMDCCSERLDNAEVYVMDSPTGMNKQKCGKVVSARGRAKIDIPCTQGVLHGRYVRVQIPSGILTLCEVQVWGKEQSCAPQQSFLPNSRNVLTSEEASEKMRASFALQQNGDSSNFAAIWEAEKKKCFGDLACKKDFSQKDFAQNVDRAAKGFAAGEDLAAGLTFMKKAADLKGMLGLVGRISPYLGAFEAFASIVGSYGTSNEVQRLDHIIDQIDDGFQRMEERFDNVEQIIETLGEEQKALNFKDEIFQPVKNIDNTAKLVKLYIDKCDGKTYGHNFQLIDCIGDVKCAKQCRDSLATEIRNDNLYNQVRDGIKTLIKKMTGLGKFGDGVCPTLIGSAHDRKDVEKDGKIGRREVIDRLMLIYRRILMAVVDLTFMDEFDHFRKKEDLEGLTDHGKRQVMGRLVADVKNIAKYMIDCDKRLKDVEWKRVSAVTGMERWKNDLDKVTARFKHTQNQEKELADAIYNELSGKYYWRHWLVYVYSNYDDGDILMKTAGRDHFIHIQADHSYHTVEGRYRILVTSIPEDSPVTTWTDVIAPMRKDIVKEREKVFGIIKTGKYTKTPAMGALDIFIGLPTDAKSKPIAAVTLEGSKNCNYCNFGLRAPKERKFHQHFTSVCHDHQCGQKSMIKWNPLYQTRRYQIVILG